MKQRFISFGSIGQFRKVIQDVRHATQFQGVDNDGELVYDQSVKMPILSVTASEKNHGTHGAVCYNDHMGFWVQSRKKIITHEKDNAGCVLTAMNYKDAWMNIIEDLKDEYQLDLDNNIISIFFEWCGGNIQKKSAVSTLTKRAIIFQYFKVSNLHDEDKKDDRWLETENVDYSKFNIFNIMNFPTYHFDIDFDNPLLSQNDMINIVEKDIEPNSLVGRTFGKDGNIGEGIVASFKYKGKLYMFKVKGDEHSKSKVKTLKPVDEVKENDKIEFANYACSPARLEQAWQSTFGIENEKLTPTIKKTRDFLRFVFADILKEESDIMVKKELTPKLVNGKIADISRRWFIQQLDEFAAKGT